MTRKIERYIQSVAMSNRENMKADLIRSVDCNPYELHRLNKSADARDFIYSASRDDSIFEFVVGARFHQPQLHVSANFDV